ncbi:dihydropteroate synthase [Candidatus Mesenet endosymbiont of Agriotes lineatus]|uniref:dihydropteroate synthase n=1 Tax=Candidatus Mesenet endosymbiont of Agriotes lineatus TaxID=3077948 RepID=UPI0030D6131B
MMTKIMGILNITPDSFSDGGKFLNGDAALKHAEYLIDNGVNIIDIGAESTRSGAILISEEEEWDRLEPALQKIIDMAHKAKIEVSIDTNKAKIAEKAINVGVDYINDVSGTYDKKMADIISQSKTKLFLMHNLGVPADKNNILPKGADPIHELIEWFKKRIAALNNLGITKIIIDPGIGFGKDAEQSWYIINNIDKLKALNFPICVGHSRKSMFHILNEKHSDNYEIETLTVSIVLAQKEIQYIRVHNTAFHLQAFNVLDKFDSSNV